MVNLHYAYCTYVELIRGRVFYCISSEDINQNLAKEFILATECANMFIFCILSSSETMTHSDNKDTLIENL